MKKSICAIAAALAFTALISLAPPAVSATGLGFNITGKTPEGVTIEVNQDIMTVYIKDTDESQWYMLMLTETENEIADASTIYYINQQSGGNGFKPFSFSLNEPPTVNTDMTLWIIMSDKTFGVSVNYSTEATPEPIKGDINKDGQITKADANLVLNYVAGVPDSILGSLHPTEKEMDLNNDNKVTALDALLILKKIHT